MTLKYRIYVGGFSLIVILQNSFDVGFSIGQVSASVMACSLVLIGIGCKQCS